MLKLEYCNKMGCFFFKLKLNAILKEIKRRKKITHEPTNQPTNFIIISSTIIFITLIFLLCLSELILFLSGRYISQNPTKPLQLLSGKCQKKENKQTLRHDITAALITRILQVFVLGLHFCDSDTHTYNFEAISMYFGQYPLTAGRDQCCRNYQRCLPPHAM